MNRTWKQAAKSHWHTKGHNNKLQIVTDTQKDITTNCKLSMTHNRTQKRAANCHWHTKRLNNLLQIFTDTQQYTLCINCGQSLIDVYFWWLSSKHSNHKNCNEIVGPADSCYVICVNVQCVPLLILNCNLSLLHLRATAKIGKYTNNKFRVLFSS